MRRSVVTVGAVIGVAVICAAIPGLATSKPTVNDTRSCGTLRVGIYWHVHATRNIRCGQAKHVGRAYLHKSDCNHGSHGRCRVQNYTCNWRRGATRVYCRKPRRLIYLHSFGV